MANDRLLTEVQRQQKYLERLPDDFTFPLFNVKQAIDSQRASAYRNTGAASREIVDNAMEAGADKIHVIFDTERSSSNRRLVDAIAFIDNGSGMLPKMVRYALSWGGGTHFDDPSFIGKFGFGLPNASINQTTRVEVYSRTDGTQPFTMGRLDIRDYKGFQTQVIPEPTEATPPEFVQRYLEKEGWALDHGTIVVWVRPDRLTYRSPSNLREHMVEDFGIVYRYLLANPEHEIELKVEGATVRPVDPMFLLPEGQYYVSPEDGGAQILKDELLSVRYFINPETGEREIELLDQEAAAQLSHEDPNLLAVGTIHARLAHLPVDFAESRSGKGPATDANRRFEVRKTHYGLSFVRNNREIQNVDAFPRSARDKGNGLGSWPLLQGYAYHVAFEVRFPAELDEIFGITNDKQSVRPIDDFWRVLTKAGFDRAYSREYRQQYFIRQQASTNKVMEGHRDPSHGELAAKDTDVALGARPAVPDRDLDEAKKRLEEEVVKQAKVTGQEIDKVRHIVEQEARRWPYKLDYYDAEDGPFYRPEWVGEQIVVYVNRKHPFFQVLYGDLVRLPGGGRAKQALDLVLIALAKAELTTEHEEQAVWYAAQRKQRWSPFLDFAMRTLEQRVPAPEPVPIMEPVEVA